MSAVFSSFTYSRIYANYALTPSDGESGEIQHFIQSYLKPIAAFLGLMLPLYLLMFSYLSRAVWSRRMLPQLWGTDRLFLVNEITGCFSRRSYYHWRAITGCFHCGFGYYLAQAPETNSETILRGETDRLVATQPIWSLLVRPEDGFLLIAIILTVIYYQLPWSKYGGGWINDQVHLYIFLVLLQFFNLGGYEFNSKKQVSKNLGGIALVKQGGCPMPA